MFDLKAKLLEKGLVTKEQADKAASDQKQQKSNQHEIQQKIKERFKAQMQLLSQTKQEQYVTIRKWVDHNRLDKSSAICLDDEKFFFESEGQVTWLTLKKDVIEQLQKGQAGIIAYMSNHGLTHAVVSREIAEDVAGVFPEWIRVLNSKA